MDLQHYDTSGRLVFVHFLEELNTPKSPFEINRPLELANPASSASFQPVHFDFHFLHIFEFVQFSRSENCQKVPCIFFMDSHYTAS